MNILFLTIAYNNNSRHIYSDLMREFRDHGHTVWVVCQSERRNKRDTCLYKENGINVLLVKTCNIKGRVSKIEKGFATLSIGYLFQRAISKYLNNVKFDLVLYSTPPITLFNVVQYIKRRDGALSYLLLKDIFPQNAVDLGLIKKNGIIHKYFTLKEQKLYKISDYIGCMSKANVEYLLKHNRYIEPKRVEVNPNSIKPLKFCLYDSACVSGIRKKYSIPEGVLVFIYGGNLGLPQGLEFLVEVCRAIKEKEYIFLLIVGDGNRYNFLAYALAQIDAPNVRIFKKLPKAEYDELLIACDVGLIFLNPKFTIPNFPSRLTAYMEMGLPVLAATDIATDIKEALLDAKCGFWSENGDLDSFVAYMDRLAGDRELCRNMGLNGRKYLEKYYTVDRSYQTIMRHFSEA